MSCLLALIVLTLLVVPAYAQSATEAFASIGAGAVWNGFPLTTASVQDLIVPAMLGWLSVRAML